MAETTFKTTGFYRMLLKLLPADFRGDFGAEMEQTFEEQHAEASRREGFGGLVRLWWATIVGIFATAPREHWGMFRQDAIFALRTMRKNLGFSVAAVITLGLGIGANTAIFSVVHAVLLKPLPYANGERMLVMAQQAPQEGFFNQPFSVKDLNDYRAQSRTLDALVEYHSMAFVLLGGREPQRVQTGVVSANFFEVMGVKPLHGRLFVEADDNPGAPAVLMLSYAYWQKAFGGDVTVLNRKFTMNDRVHTVVGILPPLPRFPGEDAVYMPTSACPFRSSKQTIEGRGNRMVSVYGRLRPGATMQQAEADLAVISKRLYKDYPDDYAPDYSLAIKPLREEFSRGVRTTMLVLLAAAGFVLLIACANVANLNLSRAVRRERELAVRSALGASRLRIFRQLLTESFLLALIGGSVGLLLAWNGLGLLKSIAALFTPRAAEISLDGTVLLAALGAAVLASMVSGSAPALGAHGHIAQSLKEGGSAQATAGGNRRRLRSTLVVAQVALSLLLLTGAGLMLRTLMNLQRVDAGFRSDNVLTMNIYLNFTKYNDREKRGAFWNALLEHVGKQPGVRSAGLTMLVPLASDPMDMTGNFIKEGQPIEKGQPQPVGDFRVVSEDYFKTLEIPLLRGRAFSAADRDKAPAVAVLSKAAAEHLWAGEDPVGKRFSADNGRTWTTIVGVVGDVKQLGLDREATDEMYVPLQQTPLLQASLVVKTAGDPVALAGAVIRQIYDIDPNQPAAQVRSLEQVRADSIAAPRLTTTLLGIFALVALGIAAAGISGVMILSVSQRTHEIGVRMAMGARPGEIVGMVMRQGMTLVLLGSAMGLAGAFALTRSMQKLLFHVGASDPATYLSVAGVLAAAAVMACAIPARRAAQVDPLVALRTE
ncbi:MAG TPA: ABC transporter permease [Methylomirabilota bacterium]|nr:ABC transporter permease [Methylomirabilota bacterium]